MNEVELKFQVPPLRRAAVAKAVAGRAPAPRIRLRAAYWDTPDRALAIAGFALRVRREGRLWVQTLKGAGPDGMTRLEHNVPLPFATSVEPVADPGLHAGTPAGERLRALLAQRTGAALRSAVLTAAMAPGVNAYMFANLYGVGRRVAEVSRGAPIT